MSIDGTAAMSVHVVGARVTLTDVHEAAVRLRQVVRRTPLLHTRIPTPSGDCEIILKLEQTQLSGTFKARGILNATLRMVEQGSLPQAGLVIASGGNAGIAAVVAGQRVGARVTVAVPHDAPQAKVNRLRAMGADVIAEHPDHAASNAWADDFARRTGALRLHAYDHPEVISGAGTLLLEALEQEPGITSVLVAVGGGGLVAGTVVAAQDSGTHVVAVEPVGAPALHAALAAGEPVDVRPETIAEDSLGAQRIGTIPWELCRGSGLDSVLVSDDDITAARELLWREHHLLVENAGACALAALTSGAWRPAPDEVPLVVLCGANVQAPV